MKVKQILGRSSDDPQSRKYITESKCLVIEKNGKLLYEIDTGEEKKFVSPEDVARLIFSKMKETAHSVLGSDANDVVITVPFDFGEKQKSALGEAARAAGFNVLRLIHEPSAALLAYGIGQDSPLEKATFWCSNLEEHPYLSVSWKLTVEYTVFFQQTLIITLEVPTSQKP